MIDGLAHHGYRLSPGTLYPMLHSLERKGYLVSREERKGSSRRKLYRATDKGREGLAVAKRQLREFTGKPCKTTSRRNRNHDTASCDGRARPRSFQGFSPARPDVLRRSYCTPRLFPHRVRSAS
ncbi:PadR family transcriptional regulator [Modicisalibacter luteus]|uniref:PadR family transcriptional regulator n=1 Tax=Modicisalibacter luteus TaxID=453962 RepID=UPI0036457EE2